MEAAGDERVTLVYMHLSSCHFSNGVAHAIISNVNRAKTLIYFIIVAISLTKGRAKRLH